MLPVQDAPLLSEVDRPHLQTAVHGCEKHVANLTLVLQAYYVVAPEVDLDRLLYLHQLLSQDPNPVLAHRLRSLNTVF